MLSSLDTYNFYTRDVTMTRTRIAADAITAREAAYYKENISNISSVEEFLDNDRVYAYAMKAYGLEEMTYAKGMIRKVLESDLSDASSFANSLTDTRYKEFAAAFDFGKTSGTVIIQTTEQQNDLVDAYQATIDATNKNQQEELAYFKAVMSQAKNAMDVFKYPRAVEFVLSNLGLPTENYDFDTVYNAMTADPDDETGYVKTVLQPQIDDWEQKWTDLNDSRESTLDEFGKPTSATALIDSKMNSYRNFITKNEKFVEMAGLFNFNTDGSRDEGLPAQTDEQYATLEECYLRPDGSARVTYGVAQLNKAYYEEKIPTITNINEILLYDDRLKNITYTAYGISLDISRTEVATAITEHAADPDAALNKWGQNMVDFITAFNFDPTTGAIPEGQEPQSAENMAAAMDKYMYRYDDKDIANDQEDISEFKRFIGRTTNLDDFLSGTLAANIVRDFALKAYGIGTDEYSNFQLKQIFTSDPADANSYLKSLNSFL